jgi:hypothetical protein
MKKTLVSILIVATVASAMAIFWHAAAMTGGAMNDDGMSPACLTVCLTHGDAGAPASGPLLAFVACVLALLVFLPEIFIGLIGAIEPIGQAQKDRHRYLMKTIVMLR